MGLLVVDTRYNIGTAEHNQLARIQKHSKHTHTHTHTHTHKHLMGCDKFNNS